MRLAAGTRLGVYEVVSLLGKGGMGEVYRARDTTLQRDVAIKVLQEFDAGDGERLQRFQREARILAALNHPHIGAIYGVEQTGDSPALVLELVEGPTLADYIARGPVPRQEVVRIASQLADALVAAHDHGIVHRDLKPSNVKVRTDGAVKVLDFGLAKPFESESGSDPKDGATTDRFMVSRAGVLIGTAAYMSPEQMRGAPADKRADIWAFGCILYEMLAGDRLFDAPTVSDIVAAVLTREPDWSRVPADLRPLLRKCLAREPRERLRDLGDVSLLLEAAPPPEQRRPRRWAPAAAAAAIVVVAAAAAWRVGRSTGSTLKPVVRLDVDLGAETSLGSLAGPDAVLSPDGTRLVYVSQSQLYTRRLDQPSAAPLAGTGGAYAPFFSPNGQWVAFFAQGQLKKIAVDGGPVIALCPATGGRGGTWTDDDSIIATLSVPGGLSKIPAAGGVPSAISEPDATRHQLTQRWPQVLPGGQAVLFTAHTTTGAFDGATIEAVSLRDRRTAVLLRDATFGRYVPSGHLLYVSRGTLFAVAFDAERLAVRGTPVPLVEHVSYSTGNGAAQYHAADSGTLIYRSGTAGSRLVTVQWLDEEGRVQPLLAKPGSYERPRLSPDGQRLALEVTDASNADIWIYERPRDLLRRLTTGLGGDPGPLWTPDGRALVFQAPGGMFWISPDGGNPQPLTRSQNLQFPWWFTQDGKQLAFMEASRSTTGYRLWTVPIDRSGATLRAGMPRQVTPEDADERHPAFSPDGRWLAYASNASGSFQIYVRPFPPAASGHAWQISSTGGVYPEWAQKTPQLVWRTEDNVIMAASYTAQGDMFAADKPRVWSTTRLGDIGLSLNFDVTADAKRLVALMPAGPPEDRRHLMVVENFLDELRRRVR